MPIGTTGALIAGSVGSSLIGASSARSAANAQASAAQEANETQRYIFDRSVELTEPRREIGDNALSAMAYQLGLAPQPTFGGTTPTIEEIPGTGGTTTVNDFGVSNTVGGTPATFSVGGQTFGTREEAEAYAAANTVDGTPFGGFETSPGYNFRFDEGQRAVERMAAARGNRLSGATLAEAQRRGQGEASAEFGNWWNRLAGVSQGGQQATNQQISAGQNYANAFGQNALAAGNAQASGYLGQNNAFQGGINNLFSIAGMNQAGLFGGGGSGLAPMTSPLPVARPF